MNGTRGLWKSWVSETLAFAPGQGAGPWGAGAMNPFERAMLFVRPGPLGLTAWLSPRRSSRVQFARRKSAGSGGFRGEAL
jgi:hypothetical protein